MKLNAYKGRTCLYVTGLLLSTMLLTTSLTAMVQENPRDQKQGITIDERLDVLLGDFKNLPSAEAGNQIDQIIRDMKELLENIQENFKKGIAERIKQIQKGGGLSTAQVSAALQMAEILGGDAKEKIKDVVRIQNRANAGPILSNVVPELVGIIAKKGKKKTRENMALVSRYFYGAVNASTTHIRLKKETTDDNFKNIIKFIQENCPNLRSLDLSKCSNLTDTGLQPISELVNLTYLDLPRTKITNTGLQYLSKLVNLTYLNLQGCRGVTDAGPLSQLVNLTYLNLDGCNITDTEPLSKLVNLTDLNLFSRSGIPTTGLSGLSNLLNLKNLDLSDSRITDTGLEKLSNLLNLKNLNLSGSEITDAGLEKLSKLVNLTRLNLGGSKITDAGLKHLSKNLTNLNLSKTNITDDGLKSLYDLKNLTRLYIGGCKKITKVGKNELLSQFPDLSLML